MQDPKQLMEQGWKAREALDFKTAEKLLNQAKVLFEKESDWFNVTECLNHLAYTQKLRASDELNSGFKLIDVAKEISCGNGTKDFLILRAEMSLLEAGGNFEKAKIVAKYLLDNTEKPNVKADLLSHLATFSLRTGDVKDAEELIEQADVFMRTSDGTEKDSVKSIWKCRILLTKALIAYNNQNLEKARELVEEALTLAEANALSTRTTQAKELLELLDLKN